MKTVFIAYTGSDDLITLPELEPGAGNEQISDMRIHGVFPTLEEYMIFETGYNMVRKWSSMKYMEVPYCPPNGMISKDMQLFHVVVSGDQEIQSVETTDRKPFADIPLATPLNTDRSIEIKYREDGTADVYCYARDLEDACRFAYDECTLNFIDSRTGDIPEEDFPNGISANKFIFHMPTSTPVSFKVPSMFTAPEVGQILDIKYEDFITDPEEWELAQSTLENDVMVVDRIEGNDVYLREGNPV